jgi:hypothetical protein
MMQQQRAHLSGKLLLLFRDVLNATDGFMLHISVLCAPAKHFWTVIVAGMAWAAPASFAAAGVLNTFRPSTLESRNITPNINFMCPIFICVVQQPRGAQGGN